MKVAIVGLTAGWIFASSAFGALTLSRNGQPQAVIVHNGHTDQAASLNAYLKKITGAAFELVEKPADAGGRPAVLLEAVTKVPGASDRPEIAMQAYRIVADEKGVRLSGGSEMGVTYAVWGFLEDHLGCRFYTQQGFEVVPAQPTLQIGKIDDFRQPAFAQRGFVWWVGGYTWVVKNRGAGYPADKTSGDLRASHTFEHLLPPGKLFAEHPEFYPIVPTGKREAGWNMGLCGTNPDLPTHLAAALQAETVKRMTAEGDRYDPMMPIPAGQGDGFTGCRCDACRKLVREEESEAAPYILMLNRALDILAKTHPQQQVITFAYFETLATPKTIKPHKNLWINVVSSDYSGHAAGDNVGLIEGNPANRDYAKALREWPKAAPNRVAVWHWVGAETHGMGGTEWPAVLYLKDLVQDWHKVGLYGISPQVCGGSWIELYRWVFLKLAWNPDADADALVRQFLEDNYGKGAAPHVWEYLKLAQAGYADSGHVPNTCRWTGFTTTMRLKMFPPSLLASMTKRMEQAEAAAAKEGNPTFLARLTEARSASLDPLHIDAAKAAGPWGAVKNAADGKRWFVAGADPLVPPAMMRMRQSMGAGYGYPQTFAHFGANNGGPLVELASETLSAAVCPDLKGQVTSAIDKRSGAELLAVADAEAGYRDMFDIRWQMWRPAQEGYDASKAAWEDTWSRFSPPSKTRLETELILSPELYGLNANNRLRRAVTADGGGLRIERTYAQLQGGNMPNPTRFTARWLLALPDPAKANVAVVGGGIKTMLNLRYAIPGGIRGAKTGERLSVGEHADRFLVDNITYAEAVSDFQVTALAVKEAGENETLTIRLDRGDGVAAVLTTPAAGWERIEVQPVIEKRHLRVTLVGRPVAMGADAATHALPAQTLTAKAVPAVAGAPAVPQEAPVAPRIKHLANGRGVNEADGAELVWIPSGEFLQGSPADKGASDERPQRKVHLDGYWIYKYPVTLQQYLAFCKAQNKTFAPHWGQQGLPADPAKRQDSDAALPYPALINWFEAEAYAKWAGAALPTEAQWEKAARGTDGREFPWGDAWDSEKAVGQERTINRFQASMLPVGASPRGASPYGVEDMAGNCWEWVSDWYAHEYYMTAPAKNPAGPERGTHKTIRGGCSLFDERFSRSAARMVQPPHIRDWTLTGFRCVIHAPGPADAN